MFWEKEIELLPASGLKQLQLERLNETLSRAARASWYAERLGRAGREGLSSLEEISELPFTTKDDLRTNFPCGLLAVPLDEAVRLHSSSGTTGNPTVVFHTARDIEEWGNLMARSLYMSGARRADVFQNTMGYGLFTGGLGMHYGAEKLGMLTIPIGPGNIQRQIWFMRQFRTTALHILPSYALRLAGALRETGVDPRRDLALRLAFVGAEPHTEGVRRRIEDELGVKVYNCYGLSELCGPGVAFECPEQDGLHLWEDHFLAEIIDPETGRPLPPGEEGELVLTSLRREAMPLVRYRTRDLTAFLPGPCPCGRTHVRLRRIKGRDDDMLIINGVNLFPMQIEKVLMKVPGVGDNYLIEIHKEKFMDRLVVKVEAHGALFRGTLKELEHLQCEIEELLKAEILVTPAVKLVEPGTLPRAEGKAKRVVDLRKIE
ncbi:MAG: phenylacetate--CoA ligase [Spirochaetales bacterium]|nr:phenylacetate--CoA ligase [Spirochaetales bacterium]